MRITRFLFSPAILTIAVSVGAVPAIGAAGDGTHAFVVTANDGYGVEDCLAGTNECGQVVADAWCEAHGRGTAISFGLQSSFSSAATKVSATSEPYIINCGD
jgi:hypothetical protein